MSEAAAAAVTATPAAAPAPAAEANPASAMTHGLDAILGDLSANDVETADSAETPAGEGDAGEANAESADQQDTTTKGREAPDDLIFSDEQLSTAEGIKRGRARVNELRKMQHQKYLELKGYEKHVRGKAEKLKSRVDAFRSEKQSHDLLLNNVRSNLQGLHSGDPETILTALGNLTGTDGLKAYELLTSRIVHKGRSPLDPQVQALLDAQAKQIEELKNGFAQRVHQEEVQAKERQISAHQQRLGEMIRASTTTPHLTRIFNDDPARLTKFIVDAITETNGAKPAHQLFAEMEQELQQHFGAVPPKGASGGTAPKQPQSVLSSPGRSVGPSVAAAATQRVPTEAEILRSLANDTELLSSLGL